MTTTSCRWVRASLRTVVFCREHPANVSLWLMTIPIILEAQEQRAVKLATSLEASSSARLKMKIKEKATGINQNVSQKIREENKEWRIRSHDVRSINPTVDLGPSSTSWTTTPTPQSSIGSATSQCSQL